MSFPPFLEFLFLLMCSMVSSFFFSRIKSLIDWMKFDTLLESFCGVIASVIVSGFG